jgi:hypothetical protein
MRALAFALLLMASFASQAQMKTERRSAEDRYPNGDLQRIVQVKTRKNEHPALYEKYKKTTTRTLLFYPGNRIKMEEKRVEKIGETGPACYLVKHRLTEYRENGKKCYEYSNRCDKKRERVTVYTDNGKRLYSRKHQLRIHLWK